MNTTGTLPADRDGLSEIMNDPSLLLALGLGSLLSLGLLYAYACCFGGEADALRAIAVLCSMAG